MLGRQSVHAGEAKEGNFIGADYGIKDDLSKQLPDNWREFNKKFIPIYLKDRPEKSKIAAGLACGMLHTVSKGINLGDIVLCPDGQGDYLVGEVVSDYYYEAGGVLPHRRSVRWYNKNISRNEMSEALRNSTGSIGTVSNISKYGEEIEQLIEGGQPATIISTDESIEDPSAFVLEKHLEDFLVENWQATEFGKNFDIFIEDGELIGQQYPTDTGLIDILAISKNKKEILVVELKRGRASDVVVGQIQRYMGYVKDELAEKNQIVRGVIIAFEDDLRIQRALTVTNNIDFYCYQINFKLKKIK